MRSALRTSLLPLLLLLLPLVGACSTATSDADGNAELFVETVPPATPPAAVAPEGGGDSKAETSAHTSETLHTLYAVLDELPPASTDRLIPPYERQRFPHWLDVSGSGCDARQDALRDQAVGLIQTDLVDRCVIVEGDWYSLFDGVAYSGAPAELDVDHVVSLADAWASGAYDWTEEMRQQFANDPHNLLVVTASANRSKGDRTVASWQPDRHDASCLTGVIIVTTKARYELAIESDERLALQRLVASCAESGQRSVPSKPLPGGTGFDLDELVAWPTVDRVDTHDRPDGTPCVDLNTAETDALRSIVHIDESRARDIVALRPFSDLGQLTAVRGIGPQRLVDIRLQGAACVNAQS